MAFGKTVEKETAQTAAINAAEEGITVLVVRFNEKLLSTNQTYSGNVQASASRGISAVESTGMWRFHSMQVENDSRTFGDRMAFYATFTRREK